MATVVFVSALGILNQTRASENYTPPLNKEATIQIGGQILHQGTYAQHPAIHLSQEISFGERQQYSLLPGYYIRTGEGLDSETCCPPMAQRQAA